MSPEFRLRPSLSVRVAGRTDQKRRVSPEFRLRPSLSEPGPDAAHARRPGVSPEFRLRPSLSGRCPGRERIGTDLQHVSPEFRLRPSLSGSGGFHDSRPFHRVSPEFGLRVAGVQAPAFVECRSVLRPSLSAGGPRSRSTWTVVSPEFRLRPSLSEPGPDRCTRHAPGVSPEFRLRPSLSGGGCETRTSTYHRLCRRSSGSGLR